MSGSSLVRVTGLRTEYRTDPFGIDERRPGLTWRLESDARGQLQTAYRVVVAANPLLLDRHDELIWDSGRVDSNVSSHVVFGGPELASRQRCHWKVQVWDRNGHVTDWSEPAWWEMGLLEPADWQAHWIGAPEVQATQPLAFVGATWIWSKLAATEAETVVFRCLFDLPDRAVERVLFGAAASGPLLISVNGRPTWRKAVPWQTLQIDMTDEMVPGMNRVVVSVRRLASPEGLVGRILISYVGGGTRVITTDHAWEASGQSNDLFDNPLSTGAGWTSSEIVGPGREGHWPELSDIVSSGPSPYLRKSFRLPGKVRSARLYASALGLYELRLNGTAVTDQLLTPGWTDYTKRVPYQVHDVTGMLSRGANVIAAVLADGWYAGHVGPFGRELYGRAAALMCQLEIELTDGTRHVIGSDATWRSADGPIRGADLLMGETYDARLEREGWATPAFEDSKWPSATVMKADAGVLVAQAAPPIRVIEEIAPMSIDRRADGRAIVDFGQNLVGWCRLSVRGQRGAEVRLRHAEVLSPDGELYTANLRNARQSDRYILSGADNEYYEPRFTHHGFRFVEVWGEGVDIDFTAIRACVVHASMPVTGHFDTSDALINRLQSNIVWSQLGNALSVPTDCPQRDERLGWTGDVVSFAATAALNCDVSAFLAKWLQDVSDAQAPSGAVPDIAPWVGFVGAGTPAWGDAIVTVPLAHYLAYGDARILDRHYEAMVAWVDYLVENSSAGLRPAAGYGDWLAFAETPLELIATAFFAHVLQLMARISSILDRGPQARRYDHLLETTRSAFIDAFVNADGKIGTGSQTAQLLGLAFDLVPARGRELAARVLVEDIIARDWHLSTGFVGTPYLLPVLSDTGYAQIAYELLLQESPPSWLHQVRSGATTIWERWDGWTSEHGFADSSMNSFNHSSFGSVGAWLYEYAAGIKVEADGAGYRRVVIRPHPGGGLVHARAVLDTNHGSVKSAWHIDGSDFRLQVLIPPNCSATVWIPTSDPTLVREGAALAATAQEIESTRVADGHAVFGIGSGSYEFVARI